MYEKENMQRHWSGKRAGGGQYRAQSVVVELPAVAPRKMITLARRHRSSCSGAAGHDNPGGRLPASAVTEPMADPVRPPESWSGMEAMQTQGTGYDGAIIAAATAAGPPGPGVRCRSQPGLSSVSTASRVPGSSWSFRLPVEHEWFRAAREDNVDRLHRLLAQNPTLLNAVSLG